jgi:hypothetical protein
MLIAMSTEDLQTAVTELSAPELARFSAWFEEYLAEQWDRQIEEDAKAGRLDHLAEQALAEYRQGHFTQLP